LPDKPEPQKHLFIFAACHQPITQLQKIIKTKFGFKFIKPDQTLIFDDLLVYAIGIIPLNKKPGILFYKFRVTLCLVE
jgi:hypothetical protein